MRLIASGLGLPYNVLSGDLSDTSYSSARVGLIEFRNYIDAVQWQFVHMFCRPIFKRWVELEVLRGGLPVPENGVQHYMRNITWARPAMQMTDPQREVDAMVRAIRAGLMSREMAVASLGYDLAEVDAQIASGNASTDAAGARVRYVLGVGGAGSYPRFRRRVRVFMELGCGDGTRHRHHRDPFGEPRRG